VSGTTWADVLALVAQLDASGLADAEIVTPEVTVRVSRSALVSDQQPVPVRQSLPEPAPEPAGAAITAPMLGVFYRGPAPGRPPFVAEGDTVTPDTTVAIIEVMKLMNTVEAGVHGVVREICVADGATVEHGDVLFRLDVAEAP
jgi:acetyl-CoA carboxylase biotin carboxyl carrier protein